MNAEPAARTVRSPGRTELIVLLSATVALLIFTGAAPYDRLTWVMEVIWVIVGLPLLVATYKRFPLTALLYRLLFLHAVILIVGGYYTYARVPLGFWAADLFHLSRNHYDRIGHFVQGFVPAVLVREILIRRSPLAGSRWLPVVVVSMCVALSAFYELIEWWGAVVMGAAADAFLATQGDPWDTQWDMFLALVGSVAALAILSRMHDEELGMRGTA